MSHKNIRILVCGHDLKFLQPLIRRIEGCDEYELRTLIHQGHYLKNRREAELGLEWADVIFCEWALDNAVWFSHRKKASQVLIVRLHLQEVQSRERNDFIYATDWGKVDRLILITQHLYDWMRSEFPVLVNKSALVYNPIPAKAVLSLPKPDEARYVLGLVGAVPARKRLDLAVAVLKQLRSSDSRYQLRVKGALPRDYPWMENRKDEMAWYSKVFEDLAELREAGAIVFDPHGSDMATWYQSVGHILSVSDFEGSHQAVAEGMASGCVPAIRDWLGAGRIYPEEYVARTVEDLAAMIQGRTRSEIFERESGKCRLYAAGRFDETPVCNALLSIIRNDFRRAQPRHPIGRNIGLGARPTFLILAYVPIASRSGYRIRVEQEIQILTQMGCIVHLACLLPPTANDRERNSEFEQARADHVDEFTALGAYVHLVEIEEIFRPHSAPDGFTAAVERLSEIAIRENVDVLHAEALYCARVAALVKGKIRNLVFSIDWHGLVPEESRMGGAHENRVKALEAAERGMLASADLNVFVSEAMVNHYHEKYSLESLPHVIVPCCVSDQRFAISAEIGDSSFGDTSLVFAYAGSMADWQCGPEMITLFAALHRYDNRCRFVFLVPSSDHDRVLQFARVAGLPIEAFNLKAVTHDEVPAHLATAHMGVLLRRIDPVNTVSSPTKFGEYLAAGLPVLMTDGIGDFSDLVKRERIGLIVPQELLDAPEGTVAATWLARIVEQVSSIKSLRRDSSNHCQTIARSQLQWECSAMRWLSAYTTRQEAIRR